MREQDVSRFRVLRYFYSDFDTTAFVIGTCTKDQRRRSLNGWQVFKSGFSPLPIEFGATILTYLGDQKSENRKHNDNKLVFNW